MDDCEQDSIQIREDGGEEGICPGCVRLYYILLLGLGLVLSPFVSPSHVQSTSFDVCCGLGCEAANGVIDHTFALG
jgi:hypothetical protein